MKCLFVLIIILYIIKYISVRIYSCYRSIHPTCIFNPHVDKRYHKTCKKILRSYNPTFVQETLMRLYDALTTMAPNIQFVLMYGGLIGYYMNRELLPFDDDLDLVVIGENSIHELIDKDGWETDEFLFEVQPWCLKRGIIDTHISRLINRSIDARMICKQTGMFIDLTFLYNVPSTDTYQARDFNAYDGKHLLPLRIGKIHGRSIYIPQNVEQTLKKRYGSVLKFNKRKLVNGQWQYADTDSIVRL